MKPILVRNNDEWSRLAPVLEKLGYPMPHGFTYNDTPNLPTVVRLGAISWNKTEVYEWARDEGEVLQTVDEYLQANPLEIDGFKPDYKALYEAQTKAIIAAKDNEIAQLKARVKELEQSLNATKSNLNL